jgi:hypothetical protein
MVSGGRKVHKEVFNTRKYGDYVTRIFVCIAISLPVAAVVGLLAMGY